MWNKKIVLVIVIVLISISILVFNYFSKPLQLCELRCFSPASLVVGTSISCRSSCVYNYSLNQRNILACNDFANSPYYKNICVGAIAFGLSDPSLCGQVVTVPALSSNLDKKEEINECLHGITFNVRQEKICQAIATPKAKNECYLYLAKNTKKSEHCKKISENTNLLKNCLDFFK